MQAADGSVSDDSVDLRIIGLVKEDDIRQLMSRHGLLPDLLTTQDNFAALGWDITYDRVLLDVLDSKHEQIDAAIEQLIGQNSNIQLESSLRIKGELQRQIASLIIVVVLMLGILALNGVMNLVGSTAMGIEQRKKEMGVLMAVVLSRKALSRMLAREGLWISLFCSALSIVLGLCMGIGQYRLVFSAGADYLHFVFPSWPIVALCLVLGVIPYVVTLLATRGLRHATITEILGRQV